MTEADISSRMVLIYENIRKQFTVRRFHISEDSNLSKFEKKVNQFLTQVYLKWRMEKTAWYAALSQIADIFGY